VHEDKSPRILMGVNDRLDASATLTTWNIWLRSRIGFWYGPITSSDVVANQWQSVLNPCLCGLSVHWSSCPGCQLAMHSVW